MKFNANYQSIDSLIGTTVILNSGGPRMTIKKARVTTTRPTLDKEITNVYVTCTWLNDECGIGEEEYPIECVKVN